VNVPNAITVARIAVTPLIAWLPLAPSSALRITAFVLFVVAAGTDYVDGQLARSRKEETDLGRLLDPLADKALLVATLLPMYLLMRPAQHAVASGSPRVLDGVLPFRTPFGDVGLAWWVLAIVVGREVFMTIFRQAAARRGVVISAIGPAKWKTGFQWLWVGAAFFWFFIATVAFNRGWDTTAWHAFASFNGLVGVSAMVGSLALTLYSLGLYVRNYGRVFTGAPVRGRS
jgi:CDP-diacylglycerol--glycerol-3-phosphate 3-phosphatidyltransferase